MAYYGQQALNSFLNPNSKAAPTMEPISYQQPNNTAGTSNPLFSGTKPNINSNVPFTNPLNNNQYVYGPGTYDPGEAQRANKANASQNFGGLDPALARKLVQQAIMGGQGPNMKYLQAAGMTDADLQQMMADFRAGKLSAIDLTAADVAAIQAANKAANQSQFPGTIPTLPGTGTGSPVITGQTTNNGVPVDPISGLPIGSPNFRPNPIANGPGTTPTNSTGTSNVGNSAYLKQFREGRTWDDQYDDQGLLNQLNTITQEDFNNYNRNDQVRIWGLLNPQSRNRIKFPTNTNTSPITAPNMSTMQRFREGRTWDDQYTDVGLKTQLNTIGANDFRNYTTQEQQWIWEMLDEATQRRLLQELGAS